MERSADPSRVEQVESGLAGTNPSDVFLSGFASTNPETRVQ